MYNKETMMRESWLARGRELNGLYGLIGKAIDAAPIKSTGNPLSDLEILLDRLAALEMMVTGIDESRKIAEADAKTLMKIIRKGRRMTDTGTASEIWNALYVDRDIENRNR